MEFIQKMKKREFFEMTLKALAGFIAGFIAIILMEAMIYGIQLNSLKKNGTMSVSQDNITKIYCVEESKGKYYAFFYNEDAKKNGASSDWSCKGETLYTKEQLNKYKERNIEVIYHAPSAFDFSITKTHYVAMTLFISGIAGIFTYQFINLHKEYKKIEEHYKKTGEILISNM
ncbi:MAG: hypothetical protein E7374_00345 [Clostridiales bacterium]|nr:hypothetical protein [Clostridiales bacterium]